MLVFDTLALFLYPVPPLLCPQLMEVGRPLLLYWQLGHDLPESYVSSWRCTVSHEREGIGAILKLKNW